MMICYACSMLLRRAQQLDIPHIITHKFLPAAAAHVHTYMKARSKRESSLLSLSLSLSLSHTHTHTHTFTHPLPQQLRCHKTTHCSVYNILYVGIIPISCDCLNFAVSADAPISTIEEAVMREYGSHLHVAMRGPSGNRRYFRQAVRSLLPLLLPQDVLTSK